MLRPVLRGSLVEETSAVALVGLIRPILWSAAIMFLGPAFVVLAILPGAPHLASSGSDYSQSSLTAL